MDEKKSLRVLMLYCTMLCIEKYRRNNTKSRSNGLENAEFRSALCILAMLSRDEMNQLREKKAKTDEEEEFKSVFVYLRCSVETK